jgi:hypothetical protein
MKGSEQEFVIEQEVEADVRKEGEILLGMAVYGTHGDCTEYQSLGDNNFK